jgi:hypothetical protein
MNRLFDIERFLNQNKNQKKMAKLDEKSGIDMTDTFYFLDKKEHFLEESRSTEQNVINLSKIKTLGSELVVNAQEGSKGVLQNILDVANKITVDKEDILNENTKGLVLKYVLGYTIFILLILLLVKTKSLHLGKALVLVIFIGLLLLGFLGYYILN